MQLSKTFALVCVLASFLVNFTICTVKSACSVATHLHPFQCRGGIERRAPATPGKNIGNGDNTYRSLQMTSAQKTEIREEKNRARSREFQLRYRAKQIAKDREGFLRRKAEINLKWRASLKEKDSKAFLQTRSRTRATLAAEREGGTPRAIRKVRYEREREAVRQGTPPSSTSGRVSVDFASSGLEPNFAALLTRRGRRSRPSREAGSKETPAPENLQSITIRAHRAAHRRVLAAGTQPAKDLSSAQATRHRCSSPAPCETIHWQEQHSNLFRKQSPTPASGTKEVKVYGRGKKGGKTRDVAALQCEAPKEVQGRTQKRTCGA